MMSSHFRSLIVTSPNMPHLKKVGFSFGVTGCSDGTELSPAVIRNNIVNVCFLIAFAQRWVHPKSMVCLSVKADLFEEPLLADHRFARSASLRSVKQTSRFARRRDRGRGGLSTRGPTGPQRAQRVNLVGRSAASVLRDNRAYFGKCSFSQRRFVA